MKSRKNTINGKVIVTGDVNELEPNEVLINEKLNEDGSIRLDIKERGKDGKIQELTSGKSESEDTDWGTFLILNFGGTYDTIILENDNSIVANSNHVDIESFSSKEFKANEQDNVYFFERSEDVVTLNYSYNSSSSGIFKIIPKKEIKVQFLYDGSFTGDVPANWDGNSIITETTALMVEREDKVHVNSIIILDHSNTKLLTVNIE